MPDAGNDQDHPGPTRVARDSGKYRMMEDCSRPVAPSTASKTEIGLPHAIVTEQLGARPVELDAAVLEHVAYTKAVAIMPNAMYHTGQQVLGFGFLQVAKTKGV